MNASAVMDPHPTTVKPTDKIKKAVKFIMENRYRNLPVIDENGCYLGVFGVNCLLKLVLPKPVLMEQGLKNISFIHESLHDLHERLREIEDEDVTICMSTDITTVSPDTPLLETLLILYENRVSIPVLDPDSCKLLGMISYFDVGEHILSA
ncbi:MAG: CBS domain-containing protein [Candidatus Sedimenticola sp. 20ELBAFRAG]